MCVRSLCSSQHVLYTTNYVTYTNQGWEIAQRKAVFAQEIRAGRIEQNHTHVIKQTFHMLSQEQDCHQNGGHKKEDGRIHSVF